jgi:branched-subunit amino acid ABC-type transport system permease component
MSWTVTSTARSVVALSSGLVVGLAYALIAYGLTIIYRTSRYFNMAQGAVAMVAAYGAFETARLSGNVFLASLGALATGIVVNVALQLLVVRYIQAADHFTILAATIAIATILEESIRISVNGGFPVALPSEMRATARDFMAVGDIRSVWLIAVAVLVAVGLDLWLRRGRGGLALRAVGEAPEIATAFGVSPRRVHVQATVVAGLTAGITGVSLAVMFDFLTPDIGTALLFASLAVVLVFGVEAVWGLLLGGVALGVIEAATTFWGASEYSKLIAYGVIMLVLVFRPAGVFQEAR